MGWQDAPATGAAPQPAWASAPATQKDVSVAPSQDATIAKGNASLSRSVAAALKTGAENSVDVAGLEGALNVATGLTVGFPAYLVGGVSGLARRALGSDEDPKEIAARYADAVTYTPRTKLGQEMAEFTLKPLEMLTRASEGAGEAVARKTESPATAALTEATLQVLPMVLLGSLGRRLGGKRPEFEATAATIANGDAKAARAVEEKLRTVYEETGIDPPAVYQAAKNDVTVLQDLASENRDFPEVFSLPSEHPEYRPSLADPDYRAELVAMREETGWAQVGGHLIREVDRGGEKPEVIGRTTWIPKSEWWQERPKGLTEAQSKAAIDKALGGEKLSVREQRLIDYMLGWARDNMVEPMRQLEEGERAARANALIEASLDERPSNLRDVDAVARASQYDDAAVERAAIEAGENRAAFMAAVRKINDRAEAEERSAAPPAGGADARQTPREQAAEQAALEARASVRELSDAELAATSGGAAAPPAPPGSIAARPTASPEPTPQQQAVLDRISVGDRAKGNYTWDQFYTDAKDELHPIKVLVDAIKEDDTLATSKDPYKLARLTRGLAGKADQFLEFSPFKFDTYENVGKPLKQIVEPVKNDLDGLRSYLVARRAIELDKRGIETGVPLDEAKKVVREGKDAYAIAAKEIGEYQEHLLSYLVDSGVMSKDGAAAMREANRDYVPFFRLMDEDKKGGAGPGMSVRSPVKSIKGSERKIIDPLESIVKNTYLFTAMAERNAVGRSLVDLAEQYGREDLVKKVAAPVKPVTVQAEEIAKFMEEHGIEGDAEAFTIFRRGAMNLADDEIAVFRDGKREVYEVPKEVGRAFQGLDHESAGLLTKILAIPAKTLRAGSTLAPDFLLRNMNRDQLMAAINSDNGYIPVLDFMRGVFSVARKDEDFQSWLKSGGANATLMSMDRRYLQQRVSEIADLQGVRAKVWNAVTLPVEMLRIGSELVENATRVGEFKRALEDGGKESAQEAAFASRELTLDFARIGAKTRGLNMITAFWNAQVEGLDKMVRVFKEHPLRSTARAGAMITLPSVLLWYANHEDPRWKEIPDWERDLFWIVLTKDHIYRIPKPFELGLVFGSVPERLLDQLKDAKPEAYKGLMKSITNVFGMNTMPTVAAPILEQMTNHSFFTDRPLIPSNLEKLLPEYQYTPYTTEFTKALGQIVGAVPNMKERSGGLLPNVRESDAASPVVIDNYIRGWSGTLGVYAVQIADAALRKSGVLPDPVKPEPALADIPVIKAFVVRYPSAQAQSIADFNEHYKHSKMTVDTVTYLARQGDADAAVKEANLDPINMIKLDAILEGIGNAQRVVQIVYKNPNFPPEEKRQIIDATYMQMIEMANAGEQMLGKIKQDLGPRFKQAPATVH